MAQLTDVNQSISTDSANSTTPFKAVDSDSTTNHNTQMNQGVLQPSFEPKAMITAESQDVDLGQIELNVVSDSAPDPSPSLNGGPSDDDIPRTASNVVTPRMVHAETVETQTRDELSRESHSDSMRESITQQTDFTDKAPKMQSNILEKTKLHHNADEIDVGPISDDENSPVITPYGSRMPRYFVQGF